jgi:hypothetical protein
MRSKLHLALLGLVFIAGLFFQANAQVNSKMEAQIIALQQEKQSRTPAQQKIDSRLLQAVRENRGEKMAPGTQLDRIKVETDGMGYIEIDITAFVDDHVIKKLEDAGAKVIYTGFGYNFLRAKAKIAIIETLAAIPEIKFINFAEKAQTVGTGPTAKSLSTSKTGLIASSKKFAKSANAARTVSQRSERVRAKVREYMEKNNLARFFTGNFIGTNTSQGDRSHRADEVRDTYGYQGEGIRIGVISDSYGVSVSGVANDIATGNLPGVGNPYGNVTPVTVVQDYASGTDEGRAMLHIVHDVAPKAQLFFATANIGGQAGFAANILTLRNTYNCDIIIDDIFYFAEAVFQDGTVAAAVNTVTAGGCLFFSSAGNSGSVLRNTSGVFEGDFNDAGSLTFNHPGGVKVGSVHNFGDVVTPLNGDIIIANGSVHNLSWSDPFFASSNDYDLFLVSSTGTVKGQSTNPQTGTQTAYEQVSVSTVVNGDRLVVFKTAAAEVRAFALNTNRGALTVSTNGQTHGHNSSVLAFGVAATPSGGPFGASVAGPFPAPFNSGNQVETFSSDGPRRMFYEENGTPITPGNLLFATNGGTVRNKPDITAADGGVTNMPAGGLNPFYGTSAAAPHAGAIAALLKSANPSLTPAQIRTALVSTALDIEGAGYDISSGVGIIQAFQAMQSINPTAVANISLGTATVTESAPAQNNNGYVDPGEYGSLTIQLKNPSLAQATTVNAVLSTTTAGVTITQPNASYGTINASGNAVNTATPFGFNVGLGVPCGTVIDFIVTVSYGGGASSPQTFVYRFPVGRIPGLSINKTLGSALTADPDYTSASGTINQRLNRFAPVSVCGTQKANPGLLAGTGTRLYHAFTFFNSNTTDQCVTVTFNAANGINMYASAFNNNGFVPATPSLNFLADQGSSSATQTFGFTAPAGQSFTIVVNEVNVGTANGSPYSLSVSLGLCSPPGTLPLTWLDFTAQPKGKKVALQWKVANETNLSHYEVEHSADGRNFIKLLDVPASRLSAINKTYDQLHGFPVSGNNYYRIKQLDLDGRTSYSSTKLVKMEEVDVVTISPNPASALVAVKAASTMKTIQVFNSTGQLMLSVKPGTTFYNLDVSRFAAGIYSVKIETGNSVITQKLVRE